MKKHLLFPFLITLFISSTSFAQLVTISETHQMPVIGDSIHYVDANTFGFDAAGTGPVTTKIWDFALLMTTGTTLDFVWDDPTLIPVNLGRDSFPGANIARRESSGPGYFYYQNTANDINRMGWFSGNANFGIYKNSTFAKEFHFPITAGQSFNSTYTGSYSPWNIGEDSVRITDGTISMNADMQGQLILPNCSLNQVLRIHVVESFHIKTFMLGMAIMDNVVSDDYYYWFVDTIFQPVLVYGITTIDGTAQTPVLRYQPFSNISGINFSRINSEFQIFPIPSKGVINLINNDQNGLPENIVITDAYGRQILKRSENMNYQNSFDLTGNAPGIYFIKIERNGIIFTEKLILE